MPAEVGLVTAFAALAAYACLGTSRHLRVTTSSTMAIKSASVVAPLALGDPAAFVALTAGLAVMVGVVLVVADLLHLGYPADFLSKPVVTGFVIGLPITIIIGQLQRPGGDHAILQRVDERDGSHAIAVDLGATGDLDVTAIDLMSELSWSSSAAGSRCSSPRSKGPCATGCGGPVSWRSWVMTTCMPRSPWRWRQRRRPGRECQP